MFSTKPLTIQGFSDRVISNQKEIRTFVFEFLHLVDTSCFALYQRVF